MLREYTREQYLEKAEWIKNSRRAISMTTDMIVGFPGETEAEFEETITLCHQVGFDGVFAFKYSPRPNTPAIKMDDSIPEEVKSRRLAVLLEQQRQIQTVSYQRHVGEVTQVMVEGRNENRGQVVGRHSQNKTVNFTTTALIQPAIGSYVNVRITKAHPNSLVGEMVM
jgi:tRNA-2-methylthio-N6-dimethylallyladenosine synthase